MRLLTTSIISSLSLLIILEYLIPVAMSNSDKQKDEALLKIEEDIYNLVKDDVIKENHQNAEVKQEVKKELRAPCGFGVGCKRRRSSSRRRSFWGKKREITTAQAQHQMSKHASLEEDEFDKVVNDLDELVENLKDSKKRTTA